VTDGGWLGRKIQYRTLVKRESSVFAGFAKKKK
jgi:hypothetical protein